MTIDITKMDPFVRDLLDEADGMDILVRCPICGDQGLLKWKVRYNTRTCGINRTPIIQHYNSMTQAYRTHTLPFDTVKKDVPVLLKTEKTGRLNDWSIICADKMLKSIFGHMSNGASINVVRTLVSKELVRISDISYNAAMDQIRESQSDK